ncbi:MAG: hypothetical protein AAB515_03595 [Patescibacteria group bacterium]
MKATLPLARVGNARVFFSRLGYHVERNGSFSRRAAEGQFPRYHVYAQIVGDTMRVDLHLDAKLVSYVGTNMHAGEYDGPLVETEIQRIQAAVVG